MQAYGDGGQKGDSSAEEHREQVKRNGAEDDGLSANEPKALERLMKTAASGWYPVLEDVVNLVNVGCAGLIGTRSRGCRARHPDGHDQGGGGA